MSTIYFMDSNHFLFYFIDVDMFIGSPNVQIKSIFELLFIHHSTKRKYHTDSFQLFFLFFYYWPAARFPFVTQNFQLTRKTMERHTGLPLIDI
jgi:hypothetical protein